MATLAFSPERRKNADGSGSPNGSPGKSPPKSPSEPFGDPRKSPSVNVSIQQQAAQRAKQTAAMHAAVQLAVKSGNDEDIAKLLDEGADVDTRDAEGMTPLIIASRDNRPNTVKLLLAHDADVNAQTRLGATALIGAATHGHTGAGAREPRRSPSHSAVSTLPLLRVPRC